MPCRHSCGEMFTLPHTMYMYNDKNHNEFNHFTVYIFISIVKLQHLSGARGDLLCRFWLTRWPLWSILMSSTYNLLMITLERYWQIVHPIHHKIHFSKKKLIGSLVFAWLIGPLYNLAFKMPTTFVVDGRY